jgi:predicted enzyme related to lactoylglutathione lyase
MKPDDPTTAALEVVAERFRDAAAAFLCGSVVRGEATASSDLDLVVVYERVERARRESFLHGAWPVEVFVHDPETLRYFFVQADRSEGVPSLADMVAGGIALPRESDFSRALRALANEVLASGPPPWGKGQIDASRYEITNLVDDLASARSRAERVAIVTKLYTAVASHFFRAQGLWSAKGKAIPRKLAAAAPDFAARFDAAFDDAFARDRTAAVIALCDSVLAQHGGRLFAGHEVAAPAEWRSTSAMLSVSVGVDVPDLTDGVKFYASAFGFVKTSEPVPGVAVLRSGGAEIVLLEKKPGSKPSTRTEDTRRYERHWTPVHIDMHVDDFAAALARALDAGATQEQLFASPKHGSVAFCSDPFGHGFCIIERKR